MFSIEHVSLIYFLNLVQVVYFDGHHRLICRFLNLKRFLSEGVQNNCKW
jgi:hypothetical protein